MSRRILLPAMVLVTLGFAWGALCRAGIFPPSALPPPLAVLHAFAEEAAGGRLFNDVIVSLFRVSVGFVLAVFTGIPLGLWMGHNITASTSLLPIANFCRNLSPLAWMPFAILWFGVGDSAAIFLIYFSTLFPISLATMAAVANVPSVYGRVAQDYGLSGCRRIFAVTLPAIAPQVITALRVSSGIAWLVDVAAEMIAGRDGLGFAVMDSRNGLRTDRLIAVMIVIGVIGVVIDRTLARLAAIPSVRWGYDT